MTFRRQFLLALGLLNVVLGVAGIFLPLLPTTPFLLLAAYLFARSSERWHHWLLNHRHLGPYIHAFRNKTGLTRSQKWRIGCSFTALMALSVAFTPWNDVKMHALKAVLVLIWLFWTIQLVRMKTAQEILPTGRPDEVNGHETIE